MDTVSGMSSLAGNPFECSTSTGVGADGFHAGDGPRTVSCIVLLPGHCPTTLTVVETECWAVDTTAVDGFSEALMATRWSSAVASIDGGSSPGWVPHWLGVG